MNNITCGACVVLIDVQKSMFGADVFLMGLIAGIFGLMLLYVIYKLFLWK